MKNQQKLNERELALGLTGTGSSWHREYEDSAWVFVGGLPYDLTEGDVICIFSQYGEIVNINLVRDKDTGKSKGFAFVCYEDQRSTILAVDNLNGAKVLGRALRVDHKHDYQVPKEHGDEDDLTVKLREHGCAPSIAAGSETADAAAVTKKKKEKKMKKEKKKKKKHHQSRSQSPDVKIEATSRPLSSPSDRRRNISPLRIKTEPADDNAETYVHRRSTSRDHLPGPQCSEPVKRETDTRHKDANYTRRCDQERNAEKDSRYGVLSRETGNVDIGREEARVRLQSHSEDQLRSESIVGRRDREDAERRARDRRNDSVIDQTSHRAESDKHRHSKRRNSRSPSDDVQRYRPSVEKAVKRETYETGSRYDSNRPADHRDDRSDRRSYQHRYNR